MSLTVASPELPLYLQMSRYTKGSTAVMELRTERFLADQAAAAGHVTEPTANLSASVGAESDDDIITGSISDESNKEEGGFSLNDFLDMVNPLQHLPIISTLYRDLTGDEIEPAARIVGGAVYGGPIGAGLAVADSILEQATGSNTGEHIMSLLNGNEPPVALASADPAIADPAIANNGPDAQTAERIPTKPADGEDRLTANPVLQQSEPIDISGAMSAALERYAAAQSSSAR